MREFDFDDTIKRLDDLQRELEHGEKRTKPKSEIKLPKLVLDIREARWVSARLYEDVERGIYSLILSAKKSPNSVELEPLLKIAEGVGYAVVGSTVIFLLKEIKDYLKRNQKRRRKINKKRSRNYM